MKKAVSVFCSVLAIGSLFLPAANAAIKAEDICEKTDYVCTEYKVSDDKGITSDTKTSYNSKGYISKENMTAPKIKNAYSYDTKGRIVKKTVNDVNGITTTIFTYDKNSNVTKREITNDNNGYITIKSTVCTYDAEGHKLTEVYTEKVNGKSREKVTLKYTYNKKGNITKEVSENKQVSTKTTVYSYKDNILTQKVKTEVFTGGSLTITTTTTFNTAGKILKEAEKYKYSDGKAGNSSTENTYDSNGNLKKTVKKNNGKIFSIDTTEYNSFGKPVMKEYKTINTDSDNGTKVYKYTYNKKGQLIKQSYTYTPERGNKETQTTEYTYNTKGQIIKRHSTGKDHFNFETSSLCTDYYDKNGNLIKKKIVQEKKPDFGTGTKKEFTHEYSYADAKVATYTGQLVNFPSFYIVNGYYELQYADSYTYTGKEICPHINIIDINEYEDFNYSRGIDYTLTYKNNKNAGIGTIVFHDVTGWLSDEDIEFPFYIAPKAPSSITNEKTATTVTLKWNGNTGAVKYAVYMFDVAKDKYVKKTTVKNPTAKITGLTPGKNYKFYVVAMDETGTVKSEKSKTVFVTTKPQKPLTPILTTGTGKITAKWKKTVGADGYQVYYKIGKSGTYKLLKTTSELSYTKTGLKKGTTYYFKVRAYKTLSNGNKLYSAYSSSVYKTMK